MGHTDRFQHIEEEIECQHEEMGTESNRHPCVKFPFAFERATRDAVSYTYLNLYLNSYLLTSVEIVASKDDIERLELFYFLCSVCNLRLPEAQPAVVPSLHVTSLAWRFHCWLPVIEFSEWERCAVQTNYAAVSPSHWGVGNIKSWPECRTVPAVTAQGEKLIAQFTRYIPPFV